MWSNWGGKAALAPVGWPTSPAEVPERAGMQLNPCGMSSSLTGNQSRHIPGCVAIIKTLVQGFAEKRH